MPKTLEPEFKPARNWSRDKRFVEACKAVCGPDGWTVAAAARHFGVSRPRLSEHVKEYKEKLEDEAVNRRNGVVKGSEQIAAALGPALGFSERRRVGTFEEFDERYFGRWICPDCEIHHATPDFHRRMDEALEGENPRVVINVPPYHAKSTRATVKHTIYETVKDPNHRTLLISKSHDFTKTFLHSINQLLTNPDLYLGGPCLIDDWGPFKDDSSTSVWNTESIYVAGRNSAEKDPTIQVLGVGGQIYGRRADTIKADDVATLENQRNPARVQQMLEWFDKEVSSRIGRRGKLIWVGTRVHPGDIYSYLKSRPGYKVLSFGLILDDNQNLTLWPDHFTYDMALAKKQEMTERDFQLVYQNIDTPGAGASFTQEMLDLCKDLNRCVGHYESGWRLIAGLDLAGGTKDSGYTCGILTGVDLETGKRFLVDIFNVKSMRAPVLKDKILEWSDTYPIYEWRVENNGLQSQIVQYNQEIVQELAKRGIRVQPHNTQNNKWDPQFGVEGMAPLYAAEMVSIPWGNAFTRQKFQALIEQLVVFPMGMVSDAAMASWISNTGINEILKRAHVPYFSERMKVPPRIARRRLMVDFASGQVNRVPLHEQRNGVVHGPGTRGYRRLMVGRPMDNREVVEPEPEQEVELVNVAGTVGGQR